MRRAVHHGANHRRLDGFAVAKDGRAACPGLSDVRARHLAWDDHSGLHRTGCAASVTCIVEHRGHCCAASRPQLQDVVRSDVPHSALHSDLPQTRACLEARVQ
eukprot:380539-Prymnesium_polylepis.2